MGHKDYCCVPGCGNRRDDKAGYSFYSIPLKPHDRHEAWLAAIGKGTDWIPTAHTRICSLHFVDGKKSNDPDNIGYIPTLHLELPVDEAVEESRRRKRRSSLVGNSPTMSPRHSIVEQNLTTKTTVSTMRSLLYNDTVEIDQNTGKPPAVDDGSNVTSFIRSLSKENTMNLVKQSYVKISQEQGAQPPAPSATVSVNPDSKPQDKNVFGSGSMWKDSNHSNKLLKNLSTLWKDKTFTDVVINVGYESFHAHRVVVAAASPFMSSLLSNVPIHDKSVSIELPCDPRAMKEILNFMYTGTLTLKDETVYPILYTARMLNIEKVKYMSEKYVDINKLPNPERTKKGKYNPPTLKIPMPGKLINPAKTNNIPNLNNNLVNVPKIQGSHTLTNGNNKDEELPKRRKRKAETTTKLQSDVQGAESDLNDLPVKKIKEEPDWEWDDAPDEDPPLEDDEADSKPIKAENPDPDEMKEILGFLSKTATEELQNTDVGDFINQLLNVHDIVNPSDLKLPAATGSTKTVADYNSQEVYQPYASKRAKSGAPKNKQHGPFSRICSVCFWRFPSDETVEKHIRKNHPEVVEDEIKGKIKEMRMLNAVKGEKQTQKNNQEKKDSLLPDDIMISRQFVSSTDRSVDKDGFKQKAALAYVCCHCDSKHESLPLCLEHVRDCQVRKTAKSKPASATYSNPNSPGKASSYSNPNSPKGKYDNVERDDRGRILYHCDECAYKTTQKYYLPFHRYYKHSIPLPDGIDVYECEVCQKKHPSAGALRDHMLYHTTSSKDQNFECGLCGDVFKTVTSLRDHTRRMHHLTSPDSPRSQKQYFQCEYPNCEFKTRYKNKLCTHTAKHSGEEPEWLKSKDNNNQDEEGESSDQRYSPVAAGRRTRNSGAKNTEPKPSTSASLEDEKDDVKPETSKLDPEPPEQAENEPEETSADKALLDAEDEENKTVDKNGENELNENNETKDEEPMDE